MPESAEAPGATGTLSCCCGRHVEHGRRLTAEQEQQMNITFVCLQCRLESGGISIDESSRGTA